MTTPANNGSHGGANRPEDDDPFGYLYEDGQAAGATPPGQGGGYGYPGPTMGGHPGAPGVPRTSHHQVRTVGDRRGGGQRGPVPQQQGPGPQAATAYQAQYQSPEALQAGGYAVPAQPGGPAQSQTQTVSRSGGHGGGGGSSRKGLLIAAVAVVAAVAIGIGAALAFGGKGEDKGKNAATGGQNQSQAPQPSASPSPNGSPQPSEAPLPRADFAGAGMSLTGGASLQNTVPGAKSAGGQYVGGLNATGAAATWTLDLPKAGSYKLKMTYGVPGKDASTTLTVNGEKQTRPINMKNFSKAAEGDWAKGWTNTYSIVQLKQGTNTVRISCETGNQCEVNLDQLWLEKE
ncbi:carbohydrate-binding protein [Streptomyces sp. NPDC058655]|uniref:carbohydrate-binding protein n=1 Tax=Streptomyces sp. NPDC058655 TaxID=3346577 RepID=UPI003657319E